MSAGKPWHIAIAGKQRPVAIAHHGRRGRQQRQRQYTERAVGDDDETAGRLPTRLGGLEQQFIKLIRKCHVERRNVADSLDVWLQRLAQLGDLLLDLDRRCRDRGKRHRTVLRHHPGEARLAAEIERQESLVAAENRLDLVDRRRLRIDEAGVVREPPGEFRECRFVLRAHPLDLIAQLRHRLATALSRRQSQHVVEQPELGADLLGQILFAAGQIGDRGIIGGDTGGRGGKRLAHRASPQGLDETQAFGRRIVCMIALGGGTLQQRNVGLDDDLRPLFAHRGAGSAIVIAVIALCRARGRDQGLE